MARVKVESLQVGMRVVGDIKNQDNMLLIPAGCTLTDKHIDLLRSWEIPEVEAELPAENDHPEDVLARLPEDLLGQLKTELEKRFWHFEAGNPVYEAVFKRALLRLARETLSGRAPTP